jgi:glutamate formiminotransferase/formiminotetrahydrofolate cyclodeaminase
MDYLKEPLARYIEDAAADKPTPGGGSVAAMAGALASTMASMAANFTVGRDKFKDVEAEVREALDHLAAARRRLLDLAHQDMAAYQAIMEAYRLPKATDAEKAARGRAVQDATRRSLGVVQGVLDACRDIMVVTLRLSGIANPNLISDVGVAAELALGAIKAARLNVEVNLSGLKDEAAARTIRQQTESAVADAETWADLVREAVLGKIRG